MIPTLESLRSLVRDAFDALWNPFGRRDGFDDYEAGDYLLPAPLFESTAASATIPVGIVRAAIAELPDSTLLGVAATVIEGWTPILLKTSADVTDVDVLVEALRDRASQFEAFEYGALHPFPTRSTQHRGE